MLEEGETATTEDVRAYLDGRVARFWIPEVIRFVADLPKTGVGKIDKKRLRAEVVPSLLEEARGN